MRDLLIGAPVFWTHDPAVAAVCLGVAALVWVTPQGWWAGKALDWFDAVGLAVYAVFGAAKAVDYGIPPVPAALMGVVTGCVGGIIRDVLAGEPSILMRPELYVTAAALAAGLYVALHARRPAGIRRRRRRRNRWLRASRRRDRLGDQAACVSGHALNSHSSASSRLANTPRSGREWRSRIACIRVSADGVQ